MKFNKCIGVPVYGTYLTVLKELAGDVSDLLRDRQVDDGLCALLLSLQHATPHLYIPLSGRLRTPTPSYNWATPTRHSVLVFFSDI